MTRMQKLQPKWLCRDPEVCKEVSMFLSSAELSQ